MEWQDAHLLTLRAGIRAILLSDTQRWLTFDLRSFFHRGYADETDEEVIPRILRKPSFDIPPYSLNAGGNLRVSCGWEHWQIIVQTPLIKAARGDSVAVVRVLLQRGASVHETDVRKRESVLCSVADFLWLSLSDHLFRKMYTSPTRYSSLLLCLHRSYETLTEGDCHSR